MQMLPLAVKLLRLLEDSCATIHLGMLLLSVGEQLPFFGEQVTYVEGTQRSFR